MLNNIKTQKHSLKVFRRFDEDIWGHLSLVNKPLQVLNYIFEAYKNTYKYKKLLRKKFFFFSKNLKDLFSSHKGTFLYKVSQKEKEFKRKKRTLKISTYLGMLKLRRFYGNLKKKQFKKIIRSSQSSINVIKKSFPFLLESRLDVVLYRSNLFNSIYTARQFISHKKIYVNGNIITRCSYQLSINDIITVRQPQLFYNSIKNSLMNDTLLVNYPAYLEVNFKLGTIIFTKIPLYSEIPFPCYMDLHLMSHKFSK